MIERRADAFERRRVLGSHAVLPVIDQTPDQTEYLHYPAHDLVVAAARVRSSWMNEKRDQGRGWWKPTRAE